MLHIIQRNRTGRLILFLQSLIRPDPRRQILFYRILRQKNTKSLFLLTLIHGLHHQISHCIVIVTFIDKIVRIQIVLCKSTEIPDIRDLHDFPQIIVILPALEQRNFGKERRSNYNIQLHVIFVAELFDLFQRCDIVINRRN